MGFFFSNLHVRRTAGLTAEGFRTMLEALLKRQGFLPAESSESADLSVFICDAEGPWISVCSDGLDFYSEESVRDICNPLSEQLASDVLTVSCFDSDCLLLNLINRSRKTDARAKVGHFEGVRQRTTPKRWEGLVGDFEQWQALLKQDYLFAEDALDGIEPQLGLLPGQGRFCPERIPAAGTGQTIIWYLSLPETADKPKLPELKMYLYDATPCEMGQEKFISAINAGGESTGLAVAFSGSYVENEEIRFRDVRLEYDFGRDSRPGIPLQLVKRQTQDGQWTYYAEVPGFQLHSAVKEGLPFRKAMDLRFQREFGVRFTPEGNERKRLDITVHFIPLRNPAGQCSWYVWAFDGSRRAFVESWNRYEAEHHGEWREPRLLNMDDFDLDDES